ncbi:hypothetical protein OG21DRAFT_1496427 [Imleria badia]|nr:hypothetical protein OG21DRAFT_1496427 [Imleria badia]
MSRVAHRLFSSSLRSSTRVNLNTAARSPRAACTRRMMSSESHASHASAPSDRPWIIGSALVFGPLLLYLVSPSSRKGSHDHTDYGHKSHHVEHEDNHVQHVESNREGDIKPIADDEGTEVSGQEVKESMEKAFEADSPKDAQEREEMVAKAVTTTVKENSATETHPQAESSTDATPIPESEPNPAAPAGIDEATNPTSDDKVQSTTWSQKFEELDRFMQVD